MSETSVVTVTRENVFTKASLYLEAEKKVPTLALIKTHFDRPQSLAIGVYLREWRLENAEAIAEVTGSRESLKSLLAKQEEQIKTLTNSVGDLYCELSEFKDWLQANHPYILSEWESYGAKSE